MRKTKRFFSILLAIAMIFGMSMTAFAAHSTIATETQFFVQRYGIHMDEEGNVTSQSTSYFTASVFDSNLTDGPRSSGYYVVYKEGVVSSDDVIREVKTKPDDAEILAKIKDSYNGGYILASNGKAVKWDKFTTDNYEMRWYVLKCEEGLWMVDDVWHVDGVVVEKDTQKPIEIVDPSDPGYTPPVYEDENPGNVPPGDDIVSPVGITSKYAYIYGYNDNIMAPDKDLQRGEVCAMVQRLAKQNDILDGYRFDESQNPIYPDTAGKWFRSGIEFVHFKNGFKTVAGENINPYVNVTRGEAFRIICLAFDFSDKANLTYEDYAKILLKGGFIRGDENGNLNIWSLITRAEFCTIYNRIIGRDKAKLVTADGTKITAETYGFTDLDESEWYYETMLKATSAYDDDGYVDIELRNHRNILDDYQ